MVPPKCEILFVSFIFFPVPSINGIDNDASNIKRALNEQDLEYCIDSETENQENLFILRLATSIQYISNFRKPLILIGTTTHFTARH